MLLPERQINKKIFNSFEYILNNLNTKNWIKLYIQWELSLIKELGYDYDFKNKEKQNFIKINNKSIKIPMIFFKEIDENFNNNEIKEALIFNKELLIENFINPNKLRFPLFRNILESYY